MRCPLLFFRSGFGNRSFKILKFFPGNPPATSHLLATCYACVGEKHTVNYLSQIAYVLCSFFSFFEQNRFRRNYTVNDYHIPRSDRGHTFGYFSSVTGERSSLNVGAAAYILTYLSTNVLNLQFYNRRSSVSARGLHAPPVLWREDHGTSTK